MRATIAAVCLVITAAACGGGGTQPTSAARPSGAASSGAVSSTAASTGANATPAAPGTPAGPASAAGQPTTGPGVPGPGTAAVVLTGGPDAGTYTGGEDPNCSVGIIGPQGWGTQYSTASVDDKGLGSIQIVSAAAGKENDENAFMTGVKLLVTVTIGPSLGENSRDYEIRVSDDDKATGTGSAQITDNGTTAVIHVTGTTGDGVAMDVTINCASVVRV